MKRGEELESEFEEAMINTYKEASSFGYRPARFLQMIDDRGGVATAKSLLEPGPVPEGFGTLWEECRLDISVEYVSLNPKWQSLFTEDELREAQRRLVEVGHEIPHDWRID